jgi:signal transduction histidine kinase
VEQVEREYFQYISPTSPQPFGGAHNQESIIEPLLVALGDVARELATAEHARIVPLALQAFLSLCAARRGFATSRSEEASGCRVTVRQHVPEDLAEQLAQEPRFWATPPGGVVFSAARAGASSTPEEQLAPEPFALRPADGGVSWYAWLPLMLAEGETAVLVALGGGDLPSAARRERVHLAGTVLAGLVAAALECAQLRQRLAQTDHAREQFVSLAAHELKSPLAVIKGYAQLLLRQARRLPPAGNIDLNGLEVINQQVSRMSHLVGELVDFSRIERGALEVEPEPLDVVELVRQMVAQRQRTLPDTIFSLIAREPALIVLADPTRLEQVLNDLLDNAVKFGQEGGRVEVTVQRASVAAPTPAPSSAEGEAAAVQSQVALISVHDYGPGLPEAERASLFTAFYRGPEQSAQRQLAGVGLGLYRSHHLVTRQRGRIWAEFPITGQATGSIFSLSLPLSPAS